MQYLEEFLLPSARAEDDFILSDHPLMLMTCYSDRVYPFKAPSAPVIIGRGIFFFLPFCFPSFTSQKMLGCTFASSVI